MKSYQHTQESQDYNIENDQSSNECEPNDQNSNHNRMISNATPEFTLLLYIETEYCDGKTIRDIINKRN